MFDKDFKHLFRRVNRGGGVGQHPSSPPIKGAYFNNLVPHAFFFFFFFFADTVATYDNRKCAEYINS